MDMPVERTGNGRRLRVVFMGTPDFAVSTLDALANRGHDLVGVFTQPDRRAGRGRRLTPPPVKAFAEKRGLRTFQPSSLRDDPDACAQLAELEPDVIVIAAYGLFLPKIALDVPPRGCMNVHPSLLPRHRGPSPVISAILAGDAATGVTIMLVDEGMDTGPVLAQRETAIGAEETGEALTRRLFDMGASLLTTTLDRWVAGEIAPQPQSEREATVTRRLTREDGRLDWSDSAEALARRARGLAPWPGAFTTWRGKTLKVIRARALDTDAGGGPGAVSEAEGGRVVVATRAGSLELLEVQMEGRRRAGASDFARGHPGFVGATLGA